VEFTNTVLNSEYNGQFYDFGILTSGADTFRFADLGADSALSIAKSIGIDTIVLLGGDDSAIDDGGSRIYFGNAGNDTIDGAAGNDTIASGQGNDTISGGTGDDVLAGNIGNDTIAGGAGSDNIFGGRDADSIDGGSGDDILSGDRGDDTLTGGSGVDILTGGEGRDRFVLQTGNGLDTISDFITGTDVLQLPDGVSVGDLSFVSSGSNTLIRDAAGNSIAILQGVSPAEIGASSFVSAGSSGSSGSSGDSGGTDPSGLEAFEAEVLRLTNEYRRRNNLNPLAANLTLSKAAETHSENMSELDFFSHTGVDGSTVGDRAIAAGYDSRFVGENIGVGYGTPEGVVQGWIASDGHRANLLDSRYTTLGVGYVFNGNDTGSENWNHYWTQVFG